ncbi:MAG: YqgE/AlgH family protein [Deltaproteobacteria bacterium]|nr:YqgE/AlgH family protein [Deltaproteobacteria bacterium]
METKLAPGFLAASPQIEDPFFKKSLIFLLEHNDDDGAFGLVVNKTASISIEDIANELSIPFNISKDTFDLQKVLIGGPVLPEAGWVIHSPEKIYAQSKIFNNIAVTASKEILEDIFNDKGPSEYIFCLGYAGWGQGQLVEEIKNGSWLHIPFDENIIFNTPLKERWHEGISKLGINPAYLSSGIKPAAAN